MQTFFAFLLLLLSMGASGESLDNQSKRNFIPASFGLVISLVFLFGSTILGSKLVDGWMTAYVILFLIASVVFLISFGSILFEGIKKLNYKQIGTRIAISSLMSTLTSLGAMALGWTEAITIFQFSTGGILYFSISLFDF